MLIFCGIELLKKLSMQFCYTILRHEELLVFHGPRDDECIKGSFARMGLQFECLCDGPPR
jgi:hypothetical protein